jgi:ribose/xylose/arabinose/galactoside ABC-type transport system permease subunit
LLFSSLLAGIAAVVQLSHGSGVTPSVGLDSIQNIMEPMMSVFIGLVMSRYVNMVFSTFIGSVLMTIISNGITAMNWPSSLYNVVIGCVLLVIMAYINIASIVEKRRVERTKAQENVEIFEQAKAA